MYIFATRKQAADAAIRRGIQSFRTERHRDKWGYRETILSVQLVDAKRWVKKNKISRFVYHVEFDDVTPILIITCHPSMLDRFWVPYPVEALDIIKWSSAFSK